MEILVRGKLPEEELFDADCLYCKTQVRFQRKEARYESSCRNESFLVITCPICGNLIYTEI